VLRIVLLLSLLFGIGASVRWVVVANVTSAILVQVADVWLSCVLVPALRFRWRAFNRQTLYRVMGFNSWFMLGSIAQTIRQAADPILLNELAAPADVTSFHLGAVVDNQIRGMTMVAAEPLQPQLTALHATGAKQRLSSAYLRGGRLSLWAAMLVAAPLIVFHEELYRVYLDTAFDQYADAPTVMVILFAIYPLMYPSVMLVKIANATEKIRFLMCVTLIAQIVNLGLTVFFLGYLQMGAVGSALATLILCVITRPLIHWPLGLKMLNLPLRRFVGEALAPGLLPAAGAVAVGEVMRRLFQPEQMLTLLACVAICATVYVAILLLCLKPADRNDMERVFKQWRRGQ